MVYESGRWDNINIFRELKFAPEQHSEAARLRRIADYRIARTAPEPVFDEIVRLAASLFETPMACICIAEAHTHWYKASVGIDSGDMPRSTSFSDHALAGEGVLCVPDARQDPQFVNFPHVTDERQVRFVAVAPLIDSDGFKLGTILVQDRKPRQPLTGSQEAILASLARVTVNHMETRRLSMGLVEAEAQKAAAVVEEAHARAKDGDTVLLSPACASFDQFNHFEDRGDQFKTLVKNLGS